QVVLSELATDSSLDRIRVEYEKLVQALKKSRENEKRLMSKCRELNAEIASTSTKVATALKLSQEDETTITSLKRELDKAWKLIDAAHDKERKDQETIKDLKEDVFKLTKATEKGSRFLVCCALDLIKMIEELTKERDQLTNAAADLREKLNKATVTQQDIEAQKETAVEKILKLQQELQVQQNELSRETRLKEKLDKEIQQLHTDMEAKMAEIRALTTQGQKAREEQQRLEQQLRDLKVLHERSTKELEQIQVKSSKLQQECDRLLAAREQLSVENHLKANELKIREEELSHMRQEVAKQTKMREAIQKKFHHMEDQKAELDRQRETLKAQIAGLEKGLSVSDVRTDDTRNALVVYPIHRLSRNEIYNMTKAVQSAEKQQDLMKLLEQDQRTLEHEISGFRQEAQKQRKIIQQLEKERDRYVNESGSLMQKKLTVVEDKEMEIFDWRKKATESECKLKQQENLLESIIAERNLYSKNLIESQISEMKRKIKTMSNQVARLKDDISEKEQELVRDQQEQKRLEKENEAYKGDLQAIKLQLEETKQLIDSQRTEQQKLQMTITSMEEDRVQQQKQLQQVIRERDSLGKHLLQRSDERALLLEKIRIQQSILSKGDFHYKQRLEDIQLLNLEIKRLRRSNDIQDRTLPNTEELRTEQLHLQTELLRERTRNSVLEDQLKPINIHRWRQLEVSDPGKYQLIQKIQALQKRLIVKTQELEERGLLLQEKEKLYVELKQVLARRPGPEAAMQLQQYRWTIGERTKKLQALTAELRSVDSKMNEYKRENQRLSDELANMKKKYLSQKRRRSEQRSRTTVQEQEALPQLSSAPRFARAAFRVYNPVKL
uniref:Cilia and flagella associated protein 58 n=1 Tax=Poecilia reticulata TaxID=8081 RepID=A0A3P9P8R4_POERE